VKPRKLLTSLVLAQLAYKTQVGVPLSTAMRQLDIIDHITRPVVVKLLRIYRNDMYNSSLFPPWLDPEGSAVQTQPDTYTYKGYFPLGVWVQCKQSSRSLT
jgi:hypothetical protein